MSLILHHGIFKLKLEGVSNNKERTLEMSELFNKILLLEPATA